MTTITLPPLPKPHMHNFEGWPTLYSADDLRTRDLEVARLVLEAAAKVLTVHQIPVGNSAAGEMACEWTYSALRECCENILALEIRHE